MGEKTGIRWTDATDNPIKVKNPQTGKFGGFYCVKISPGCTNCYAASMVGTGRFGEPIDYVAGPNTPELYLDEEMLVGWVKKGKPKKRFVSSMTDIFGEFLPNEWVFKILDAQLAAPNQTFLNLTKRAARMKVLTAMWMDRCGLKEAPSNIWMGFSAEDQPRYDERIIWAKRLYELFGFLIWISAEPLLGPIILDPGYLSLGKKTWVIVGGESGARARPMHPQWARDLRDQCIEAGIPYFFKQWGEWYPLSQMDDTGTQECVTDVHPQPNRWTMVNGERFEKRGKYTAGYLLDGQEWSQFPNECQ